MLEHIMQFTPDALQILESEQMPDTSCGYYMRRLRESAGISQTDLAATTSLSTSYISHMEDGTSNSSIPTADNICKALKVPLHTLYEAALWFHYI